MGHKTVCDVHLGDYGLQIGEVIYAILEDGLDIADITLEYLDVTYPKMSKLCKENPELLEKCAQITKELQVNQLGNLNGRIRRRQINHFPLYKGIFVIYICAFTECQA